MTVFFCFFFCFFTFGVVRVARYFIYFLFVFKLKFFGVYQTFIHAFTQFFSCTVGICKCWTVCFFVVWEQHVA